MITQLELFEMLNYNPYTGKFHWIISKARRVKIGDSAGYLIKGYFNIMINGKNCASHRLAWLYMTGDWPKDQIDHIDTNRINNKWNNLREANNSQNHGNKYKYKNNKSGIKGVCWDKSRNKWLSQIQTNNRYINLGHFDNIEDAAEAYKIAAIKHFKEFARYDTIA